MALRDRLRSAIRTLRAPAPRAPIVLAPAVTPSSVVAQVPRGLADTGTALLIDLDEVGLAAVSDVRAPHVVVVSREPWRAAAAAERLHALGQDADWLEPALSSGASASGATP